MAGLRSIFSKKEDKKKVSSGNLEIESRLKQMGSSAAARHASSREKCGLFVFGEPASDQIYTVDIIAVHGLGGDWEETWTADNGNLWLRDFLPEQVPTARIMSYGYDSSTVFSKAITGIEDEAAILLERLNGERQAIVEKTRPILFIGHRLGGILVKKLLILANERRKRYGDILQSVTGLMFFGVPHRGADLAYWANFAVNVLKVTLPGFGTNTSYVKALKRNSKTLADISLQFVDRGENLLIRTFYETEKYLHKVIVDKDSAILKLPNEVAIGISGANYKTISKFSGAETQKYQLVKYAIADLMEPIISSSQLPQSVACLRSLSFSNMDDRWHDITSAHHDTCNWLFKVDEFQKWIRRDDLNSHNGVLWIKGKPGAGKSTLMKHTVLYCGEELKNHLQAAYFFNARGDDLEKTRLGLLQSLVFQLVDRSQSVLGNFIPKYQNKLKKHGDHDPLEWSAAELENFLLDIPKYISDPVVIFVDALDECSEEEVRKVVGFLEKLSKVASNRGSQFQICLSSRHYPHITMKAHLEIIVEKQPEHYEDVVKYVRDRLVVNDSEIEKEIGRKASGVFMWVILVVEMLNKDYDDGESRNMRERLEELPDELEGLFQRLFKQAEPDRKTILMFQWVLFAERPLTPQELYFAVLEGTEMKPLRKYNESGTDEASVNRFIIKYSRGLIETRDSKHRRDLPTNLPSTVTGLRARKSTSFRPKITVQFIHESVKDFLGRNNRLQGLDTGLESSLIGTSHDRLASCCMSYLMAEEIAGVALDAPASRRELAQVYPLLEYASLFIFIHAEAALAGGVGQDHLLHSLQQPQALRRLKIFHDTFESNSVSQYGMQTQLLYALCVTGRYRLAQVLLLNNPWEVNAEGGYFGNALQAASYHGHERIVRLLLDKGSEVNYQGGYFGNALQAASYHGSEQIVQLLLDRGTKVNVEGGYYGSALQAASYRGSEQLIQLLLDRGTKVNFEGGRFGSALQAASFCGSEQTVRLLLDRGAKVNFKRGRYGSALQAAFCSGDEQIVQLLLDRNADIKLKGREYRSTLQIASERGWANIVAALSGRDRGRYETV